MPDAPLTVLIVDDHALFRTGLAMMLAQSWPQAQVLQAASLAEGLHRVAVMPSPPSLVLLDVHLPDGNGLDAVATWAERLPGVPVVMISAELSAAALRRAREAGVAGFVHKGAAPVDILASLRSALAGQAAYGTLPYELLSPPTATVPAAGVSEPHAPTQPSSLQLSILQHLGRGAPNKSIARQLGLGEMQVRAEVSWLTEMLDASSREEAYRKALDLGWVRP
jgi:DNA-binding NarL/FixJ family response regulator